MSVIGDIKNDIDTGVFELKTKVADVLDKLGVNESDEKAMEHALLAYVVKAIESLVTDAAASELKNLGL